MKRLHSSGRRGAFLPLALLIALMLVLPVLAQAPQILKVAQPAKLYPDPDLSSPPLGQAPVGLEAAILKKLGNWYKVKVGKLTGWLPREALHDSASLLNGDPVKEGGGKDVLMGVYGKKALGPGEDRPRLMAEQTPSASARPRQVEVTQPQKMGGPLSGAPPLRMAVRQPQQAVYQDPDDTGSPLVPVPQGEQVDLTKFVGDWIKVKYQGKTGWMPAKAFEN
jgi:hypothetical protein